LGQEGKQLKHIIKSLELRFKVGLGICYDIRFAELAQVYAQQKKCKLLVYPGAFNMTTGTWLIWY